MEDYTTDHRGDVGSWVRLAAMDAIEKLVTLWSSSSIFDESFLKEFFTLLKNFYSARYWYKSGMFIGSAISRKNG